MGGSILYGDVGGNIPGNALSLHLIGGVDAYAKINNTVFATNFDTDATTTVNNFEASLAADPVIGPLVTTVNHTTYLTIMAAIKGYAGNSITTATNALNGCAIYYHGGITPTFQGGSNGAITNGIGNIVLCTIAPNGGDVGWTSPMETVRTTFNAAILAYTGAGVVHADLDLLLKETQAPRRT